jgi:hypothetical protein
MREIFPHDGDSGGFQIHVTGRFHHFQSLEVLYEEIYRDWTK